MEKDLLNHAFGVTPGTVYGLLLGFLVVALIAMTIAYIKKDNRLNEVIKENNELSKQTLLIIEKLSIIASPEARSRDLDSVILHVKEQIRIFLNEYKS